MKLNVTMCYSHLLWMLTNQYSQLVFNSVSFSSPDLNSEGFNGYIETKVTFEIKNLKLFSEIFDNFYTATDELKLKFYNMAKGNYV